MPNLAFVTPAFAAARVLYSDLAKLEVLMEWLPATLVFDPKLLCEDSMLERACELDTADPYRLDADMEEDDRLAELPVAGEKPPRFVADRALPAVVPRLAVVVLFPELRAVVAEFDRLPAADPLREPAYAEPDRPPYAEP